MSQVDVDEQVARREIHGTVNLAAAVTEMQSYTDEATAGVVEDLKGDATAAGDDLGELEDRVETLEDAPGGEGGGISFDGLDAQTPPLPLASLLIANVPQGGINISGSGIAGLNTDFTEGSTINSRPSYVNGTYIVKWNTSGFSGWVFQLVAGSVNKFVSYDDVATPDLITTVVDLTPIVVSGNARPTYNVAYVPNGVLIGGKLKFIRSSALYFQYESGAWKLFDDDEDGNEYAATAGDEDRPSDAVGWTQVGSFPFGATVIADGTSLAPVPVVAPIVEVKTIEWGDLVDPDPTFAGDSDLVAPSQKAVNARLSSIPNIQAIRLPANVSRTSDGGVPSATDLEDVIFTVENGKSYLVELDAFVNLADGVHKFDLGGGDALEASCDGYGFARVAGALEALAVASSIGTDITVNSDGYIKYTWVVNVISDGTIGLRYSQGSSDPSASILFANSVLRCTELVVPA